MRLFNFLTFPTVDMMQMESLWDWNFAPKRSYVRVFFGQSWLADVSLKYFGRNCNKSGPREAIGLSWIKSEGKSSSECFFCGTKIVYPGLVFQIIETEEFIGSKKGLSVRILNLQGELSWLSGEIWTISKFWTRLVPAVTPQTCLYLRKRLNCFDQIVSFDNWDQNTFNHLILLMRTEIDEMGLLDVAGFNFGRSCISIKGA